MTLGFFTKEQLSEADSFVKVHTIQGCPVCGLDKGCKTPYMEPTGDFRREILIVAEAPGKTEDEDGVQLVGKAGQLLRRFLRKYRIDLDRDCLKTNAIVCRPPDNKTPNSKQIAACRPRLLNLIKEKKPKVVILLGDVAMQSVIGSVWRKELDTIGKWRGWTIPDRTYQTWLCPTFHPSYLVRNEGREDLELIFSQDLKGAIDLAKDPLPEFPSMADEHRKIRILYSEGDVQAYLRSLITSCDLAFFDYETTGLKPHAEGHDIICVSISTRPDSAEVFLMSEAVRPLFKRFLKTGRIRKGAQNKNFESMWSEIILKEEVKGWTWDTMLVTHMMDNRPKVTGLKFQSYVQFGIADYDSEIEPYLKSRDGANGFNRIRQAPQDKLLLYCGMDSMLEHRWAKKQSEILGIPL